MQDILLKLQKQIIEYDKLFREQMDNIKETLDEMTETLNQFNNK